MSQTQASAATKVRRAEGVLERLDRGLYAEATGSVLHQDIRAALTAPPGTPFHGDDDTGRSSWDPDGPQ